MVNTLNEYINNIIDDTDDEDILKGIAENKNTDFETKMKAIHKIKKIRNMNLGEKELTPIAEDEYIDENKTYSFVDKSKEEDFNKFIEIKSFLSEQLKGDVGRSRINYAVSILEKKFKSNLDLIYKGTSNDEMKQDYISDNNNILSNLKQIIFEYNLKEQELLKEKESKNIEDSFSEIKKYLDLSLLSKES